MELERAFPLFHTSPCFFVVDLETFLLGFNRIFLSTPLNTPPTSSSHPSHHHLSHHLSHHIPFVEAKVVTKRGCFPSLGGGSPDLDPSLTIGHGTGLPLQFWENPVYLLEVLTTSPPSSPHPHLIFL